MKKLRYSIIFISSFIVFGTVGAAYEVKISSFTSSEPSSKDQSVTLSWGGSENTNAEIGVVCHPGTISFSTNKGTTTSCDKGQIWYGFSAITDNSITVYPSGNTQPIAVNFILNLTRVGALGYAERDIATRTITVVFGQTTPTITSFSAKDLGRADRAVALAWESSIATDVLLGTACVSGSVGFMTDKNINPSCEKGVWEWNGQKTGDIIVYPSSNDQPRTVDFTLTLMKNGSPSDQSKKISVTFPAAQNTGKIILFDVKDPNPRDGSSLISWQSSGIADVSLDVACAPGTIGFKTDKNNAPTCEKGGVWHWENATEGSITVYPSGNVNPVSAEFILTSRKNGTAVDSQAKKITFQPISSETSLPVVVLQCVDLMNNLRYQSVDIGTKGEVSKMQGFLNARGYLVSKPTGYFGNATVKGVKSFQKEIGVTPITGTVGPLTRARIKKATCGRL